MKYSTVRHRISDGDLIALCYEEGLLWWLISKVTRSPYIHTGVAIWLEGGLYVAEMNWNGNRLIPLSQIQSKFDVYNCPVDGSKCREIIKAQLRNHLKYDFGTLFKIGLKNILQLRSYNSATGNVCSSWCANIYKLSGWEISSTLLSPGGLVKQLEKGIASRVI